MRIHKVTKGIQTAIKETLCCRVGLTWSGTRNKGTSVKQGKTGMGWENYMWGKRGPW